MGSLADEVRYQQMTEINNNIATDGQVVAGGAPPQHIKQSPLQIQIGGDHYKSMKMDILEYICLNSCTEGLFGALRKDVMKYIWRRKGGMPKRIEDLEKARHTLDVYIEELKGRENLNRELKELK